MSKRQAISPSYCSVLMMIALAAAGCNRPASKAAATVDGNAISAQAVVAAVPADDIQKRKARLESFVAEQLLANAAVHDKLEGLPEVESALETSRRTILARAYIATMEKRLAAPSDSAIQDFYAKRPELFSARRVYRLQEIAIAAPASQLPSIKQAYGSLKTFQDRAEWLKKQNIPFTVGASIKPAEDLPADLVASMLKMRDGSTFNVVTATGFTTVQITGIEEKPLTLVQAQPHIQRFLHNMALREAIEQETARLRKAASIEYVVPYAAQTSPAPAR